MERTLLLFYILSCIHKAIKGFINKSIFTMDMRLLRKRNRKSLSGLVSKSIVSKLFFLQNVYLSLGIFFHLPPPLSLFQRYSTVSFDTCDLYYRIKPSDMYYPFFHQDCKIPEDRVCLLLLSPLWNVAQGQQCNRHTGRYWAPHNLQSIVTQY